MTYSLGHIWKSRWGWRLAIDSPKVSLGFGGEEATYFEELLPFLSSLAYCLLESFYCSPNQGTHTVACFCLGFINVISKPEVLLFTF